MDVQHLLRFYQDDSDTAASVGVFTIIVGIIVVAILVFLGAAIIAQIRLNRMRAVHEGYVNANVFGTMRGAGRPAAPLSTRRYYSLAEEYEGGDL